MPTRTPLVVAALALAAFPTASPAATQAPKIELCVKKSPPHHVHLRVTKRCPSGWRQLDLRQKFSVTAVVNVPVSGAKGDAGATGEAGASGTAGATGLAGAIGATGAAGLQGPVGPAGPQGPPGLDGKDGAPGLDGTPGTDGAPGLDGTPGTDGAPGLDGTRGTDGAPGLDGTPGKDGAPGLDGTPGKDGAPGLDGTPGKDGAPGLNGAPGLDGKDGAVGPQGPAGPQGPKGEKGDSAGFWVFAAKDGTLNRGSGVESVTKLTGGPGRYRVKFSSAVSACAYMVTLARSSGGNEIAGQFEAALNGTNTVDVWTYDRTGEATDRAFSLMAVCS